jgi:NADPH-dependent curcumin reductase CurA
MLEVVASNSQKFKVGDRVNGFSKWAEYIVLSDSAVMPAR